MMAKPKFMNPDSLSPLTLWQTQLLAGHLRLIYTQRADALSPDDPRPTIRMAVDGPCAVIHIVAGSMRDDGSAKDGTESPDFPFVWDQVYINGHWCGNRCGGAEAYTRLMCGDPRWMDPLTTDTRPEQIAEKTI